MKKVLIIMVCMGMLGLAGMACEGQTTIDAAEAINVTFPDYVKLMQSIGADIRIAN